MRLLRALCTIAAIILIATAGAITWLSLRKPKQRPASNEVIARTPTRLARGKYLAENLCGCIHCHSDHLFDRYGMPPKPGTFGEGGLQFDEKLGVPGTVCAQNITSDRATGIGAWTDGEIMRALREGVARDGHGLFPMMPYPELRRMSDEDARSVVTYLRSLPPIRHVTPPVRINFPVDLFIKFVPQPLTGPVAAPPPTDTVAYGRYLVTLAGCPTCHTPFEHGQVVSSMAFAGGRVFPGPWGRVVSANITPDPETGIGRTSRDAFIGRFKSFAGLSEAPLAPKGRNTVMDWLGYSHLTDSDLGAIYDYLRTVRPIVHKVDPFEKAS